MRHRNLTEIKNRLRTIRNLALFGEKAVQVSSVEDAIRWIDNFVPNKSKNDRDSVGIYFKNPDNMTKPGMWKNIAYSVESRGQGKYFVLQGQHSFQVTDTGIFGYDELVELISNDSNFPDSGILYLAPQKNYSHHV